MAAHLGAGGLLKDVDLIVEQPFTGERMLVQVKSQADQSVVQDYACRLAARGGEDRLLLVCHSPTGSLREPALSDGRHLQILTGPEIAHRQWAVTCPIGSSIEPADALPLGCWFQRRSGAA